MVHACATGVTKAPIHPISKGVIECLLSLELERWHGPPLVLLGVEVLVGPMKEAWSSVSLRHLEGLWWQSFELTLMVREVSSRQGSFLTLSVEGGFWGGDLSPSLSLPLLSL